MTMLEGFHEGMIMRISTQGKSKQEVLTELADHLQAAGYVKESYADGILKREEIYPTGLTTGQINVAVPHTDCHCRRTSG